MYFLPRNVNQIAINVNQDLNNTDCKRLLYLFKFLCSIFVVLTVICFFCTFILILECLCHSIMFFLSLSMYSVRNAQCNALCILNRLSMIKQWSCFRGCVFFSHFVTKFSLLQPSTCLICQIVSFTQTFMCGVNIESVYYFVVKPLGRCIIIYSIKDFG